MLLIVGLNGSLWFSIFSNFYEYFKYPVESFVRMSYSNSMTFPAVTLCNYNQFRRTAVDAALIEFFNKFYSPNSNRGEDNIDIIFCFNEMSKVFWFTCLVHGYERM